MIKLNFPDSCQHSKLICRSLVSRLPSNASLSGQTYRRSRARIGQSLQVTQEEGEDRDDTPGACYGDDDNIRFGYLAAFDGIVVVAVVVGAVLVPAEGVGVN